jgi:hypothetical protein
VLREILKRELGGFGYKNPLISEEDGEILEAMRLLFVRVEEEEDSRVVPDVAAHPSLFSGCGIA